MMGLGFGTWLSRLPSLRDELGASTLQMSLYGLCLAAGSLGGMVIAGRLTERLGARRVLAVFIALQVVFLPLAVTLILTGNLVVGLAVLFAYGLSFSVADIAMNVSGASAERAYRKPRLPLMHAGYSIGVMLSMGIGAVAESLKVPLAAHYLAVMVVIAVVSAFALGKVPVDESHALSLSPPEGTGTPLISTGPIPVIAASETSNDAIATTTGSIPIISIDSTQATGANAKAGATGKSKDPADRPYSPWRDRRVLLIGLITLSAGLVEGAPADWLPLALVDGRGVSNEFGAIMLGLFFGAVVTARLLGSVLLTRFGRSTVLRASFITALIGILIVLLLPSSAAMVIGTVLWGLGTGVCWPVTISAAADNPKTAARDVATVSAVGYTSMLIGPMAFGVLGEYIGLMQAFWVLPLFALVGILLAGITRQR